MLGEGPERHKLRVIEDAGDLTAGAMWSVVEMAGRQRGVLVRFTARTTEEVRALERAVAFKDVCLAPVVDFGLVRDEAWVLYAGDLEDALENFGGPMPVTELAPIADALLAALERAHAAGLVHPGIHGGLLRMATRSDGRLSPELLGLGLAPPPGRHIADDVFDVAVLIYTLYAAKPPFAPDDRLDGSVAPEPLSHVRSGSAVPQALDSAISQALGPPAIRFATAEALRLALASSPRSRGPSSRVQAGTNPHLIKAIRHENSTVGALPGGFRPSEPLAATPRSDAGSPELARAGPQPLVLPLGGEDQAPRRSRWPLYALLLLLLGAGIVFFAMRPSNDSVASQAPDTVPKTTAVATNLPDASPSTPPDTIVARAEPVPLTVASADAAPAPEVAAAEDVAVAKSDDVAPLATVGAVQPAAPDVAVAAEAPGAPDAAAATAAADVGMALVDLPQTFSLASDPPGAAVFRGDVLVGKTPLDLQVTTAELPLVLRFERAGYYSFRKTVAPGDTAELSVRLKKVVRETPKPDPNPNPNPGGGIFNER